MYTNGFAGHGTDAARHNGVRWMQEVLLLGLLITLPATTFAQASNQILATSPNSASRGTTGLRVTFTLDTDFPPPPPPGDGPQSVMIGGITGTAITHTSRQTVTAVFDIPALEAAGPKDANISFSIPGGTLVFSGPAAFTVTSGDEYTIERTLADQAQRNTIAFDGLAFLTGDLGGQTFLPPGKVADFSGFQYLRDNDPTGLGHNTDFVTIVAFNVLHILTADQVGQLVASAQTQVSRINAYAYARLPLIKAFRRLLEGDLPAGSTGLDESAVMAYSADLYRIDGRISYDRAELLGGILRSLTAAQTAALDSLKTLGGVGNWDRDLPDPLQPLHLDHDVNVAVMTYASELYSWYAGNVESDVYFCPERQGTYFGSFYLKDWPAMGNPNFTIDEQLTARAGEEFLAALTDTQVAVVTDLVDLQRVDLYAIVERRREIATLLRQFMITDSVDSTAVLELSAQYGDLDGAIVYDYATHFASVHATLSASQEGDLAALADSLGYIPASGAFLYSQPIVMPEIMNTDFLFAAVPVDVGESVPALRTRLRLQVVPNPFNPAARIRFSLPLGGPVTVTIYDAAGRLVADLLRAELAPGDHDVLWDGADLGGRAAPSGIYLVRVRAGQDQIVGKITLVQ